MNHARLSLIAIALLALFSPTAHAQTAGLGRPTAGIFGGYTHPVGDLQDTSGEGWNAGGLIKMRVYGILDARLDGTYTKFGRKHIPVELTTGGTATVHSKPTITYGTLTALVNMGPDSAAYPGDNSTSPYLFAGLGYYRLDFDFTCTGECQTFPETNAENHLGVNAGFGVTAPFAGIRTFLEGRYHRISRSNNEGARSFATLSVGVKFR
jgi:opacity protein-like surface antigen